MYKYQRIYIDNNIIAFIKNIIFKKPNNSDLDVFMTFDKRSIWNYRKEIKVEFGVEVKLPSEIAEYYKYVL